MKFICQTPSCAIAISKAVFPAAMSLITCCKSKQTPTKNKKGSLEDLFENRKRREDK
jgi:hypothetical protein